MAEWYDRQSKANLAAHIVMQEADLAAARAEIERLNNAQMKAVNQISDLAARLGQAEGRLDASELVGVVEGWRERALKAEAALEAYGREKVREGMQRAADLCKPAKAKMDWGNKWEPARKNPQSAAAQGARKQCYNAILAAMEKEGGK